MYFFYPAQNFFSHVQDDCLLQLYIHTIARFIFFCVISTLIITPSIVSWVFFHLNFGQSSQEAVYSVNCTFAFIYFFSFFYLPSVRQVFHTQAQKSASIEKIKYFLMLQYVLCISSAYLSWQDMHSRPLFRAKYYQLCQLSDRQLYSAFKDVDQDMPVCTVVRVLIHQLCVVHPTLKHQQMSV